MRPWYGYIQINKIPFFVTHILKSGAPKTFQSIYQDFNTSQAVVNTIIDDTFSLLNRLYHAATFEQYNIFKAYDFDGKGWNWKKGGR